jgi:hypothetical protein
VNGHPSAVARPEEDIIDSRSGEDEPCDDGKRQAGMANKPGGEHAKRCNRIGPALEVKQVHLVVEERAQLA